MSYIEIDEAELTIGTEVQFDGETFEITGFDDDIACIVCNGHREFIAIERIVFDSALACLVVKNRVFG